MNIIDVSSKISGLSKETCKGILADVKANLKKLDDCSGPHNFHKAEDKPLSKYFCSKCGGHVDSHFFHAYNEGLKHGSQGRN